MAPSGLVMLVRPMRLGCHWCMRDLHIMFYELINVQKRNGIVSLCCRTVSCNLVQLQRDTL